MALEVYTAEQLKPKNERRSLRDVVNKFHIDHTTLSQHYKGGISMSSFNSLKQKLTVVEEKVLVAFALGCTDRGLPITHAQLAGYANQLLEKRIGPDYVPVGQNWTDRFIERHHKTMQTHWSHPLDSQHARALNHEVVKHWFSLVEQYIIKPGIKPIMCMVWMRVVFLHLTRASRR